MLEPSRPDAASLAPLDVVARVATCLLPGARVSVWRITEGECVPLIPPAGLPDEDVLVARMGRDGPESIAGVVPTHARIVPLIFNEKRLGALVVVHDPPRPFREWDREALDTLADYSRGILAHVHLIGQITRAKREWERTFDALTDPLVLVSPDYKVIRANTGAAALVGMSPKEFVTRRCHEALRRLPEPCPGCPMPHLLQSKEPAFLELEHVLGDRVHNAYFYPLLDEEGRLQAVVEHVQDVTQQRKMRDRMVEAQKGGALGTMVSGIAHNFNNFLDVILGQAELLRSKLTDETLLRELDLLQKTVLDAAALIKRLRQFSRKDRPRNGWTPVDLNSVVREVLDLIPLKDREPAVALLLDLAEIPPVLGNPLELKEVVLNLIFNALDAMPNGGRLTITTRPLEDPDSGLPASAEVTVADTGVGMTDAVRVRVFDPFFTTKEGHGTGLGLSVSCGVIRRHGGEITCESAHGRGSRFTVTLPAIELNLGFPKAACGRPRVLVVDDSPGVVAALEEILAALDCEVTRAAGGSEALTLFTPGGYDLVITDLAMPDLSGWQVATAIRDLDRAVPIVLTSGWEPENLGDAMRQHHIAFLKKPFAFAQVQSLVVEALSRRRSHPGHVLTPIR
jgi:signal transduction histidine kinase/ActR/RegA family two-component response regulator